MLVQLRRASPEGEGKEQPDVKHALASCKTVGHLNRNSYDKANTHLGANFCRIGGTPQHYRRQGGRAGEKQMRECAEVYKLQQV
jgi:hypothetical protein